MWIEHVPYEGSEGRLRALYDRVKGPDNNVDNIMLAHSLRPHSMEGHMALYKVVLHHPRNEIPKWFLEALGVYTSHLNGCAYCVEHHFAGMCRLLEDSDRSNRIRGAIETEDFASAFNAKESAALAYARTLSRSPGSVRETDIVALRDAGWNDGEILEINQVTAYFHYANRTVLGLGVNTRGDVLGLSPSDEGDLANWNHR